MDPGTSRTRLKEGLGGQFRATGRLRERGTLLSRRENNDERKGGRERFERKRGGGSITKKPQINSVSSALLGLRSGYSFQGGTGKRNSLEKRGFPRDIRKKTVGGRGGRFRSKE